MFSKLGTQITNTKKEQSDKLERCKKGHCSLLEATLTAHFYTKGKSELFRGCHQLTTTQKNPSALISLKLVLGPPIVLNSGTHQSNQPDSNTPVIQYIKEP